MKILIFWASVDRMLRVVHLRVTSLSSFSSFSLFLFPLLFLLRKTVSSF